MVTLLITSILLAALLAVGLYFWQKPSPRKNVGVLPPPPSRGLFGGEDSEQFAAKESEPNTVVKSEEDQVALLERARQADKTALIDAQTYHDSPLYNQVLNLLVEGAESDPKLLALVSYTTRNKLPVNKRLAEAFRESWRLSPDRGSTAKLLHIAALSDDAAIYQAAVESALQFWRRGQLSDISPDELRALFEGEFWVLSSRVRSSGAGFLLKRALAGARNELQAAAHIKR